MHCTEPFGKFNRKVLRRTMKKSQTDLVNSLLRRMLYFQQVDSPKKLIIDCICVFGYVIPESCLSQIIDIMNLSNPRGHFVPFRVQARERCTWPSVVKGDYTIVVLFCCVVRRLFFRAALSLCIITAAHTVVEGWYNYYGKLLQVCHYFAPVICFRQPDLGSPATDLAEIWQADQKLVKLMNAGPKGVRPPQIGDKTEKSRSLPTVRSL